MIPIAELRVNSPLLCRVKLVVGQYKDLRRLSVEPRELTRYLIVNSEHTKNVVEKRIKLQEQYPQVTVIAMGLFLNILQSPKAPD